MTNKCQNLVITPGEDPFNQRLNKIFCSKKNEYITNKDCQNCTEDKTTPIQTKKTNREHLDQLLNNLKNWLYIEDPETVWTLAATKISHKIVGDPVWLIIIGPSSDGKSELLKAFQQQGEPYIDDLTSHTFISGYVSKATKDIPQYAERIANKIWYIYDLSILLSKNYEERGEILSQMRQIYDGKIVKALGNKQLIMIDTPNNTLICGSTPAIDATILEDQIMGTRFMTWRTKTANRFQIMQKISEMEKNHNAMRNSIKTAVQLFEQNIEINDIEISDIENQNLQLLANQTTLLRTSVQLDKNKELSNIAYPEGPGRLFKQLRKMYRSYRIIGLTEEEAIKCCRKLCIDCVLPTRLNVLKWMIENNKNDGIHNTTEISIACQMGKGSIKSHLSSLMGLGIVSYNCVYDQFIRREVDQWKVLAGNDWNLMLGIKTQQNLNNVQSNNSEWKKILPDEGKCSGCGIITDRIWSNDGNFYCDNCHSKY